MVFCSKLWRLAGTYVGLKKNGTRPKHMLWALHFLKTYDIEVRIAKSYYVTRKTFRKWLWPTVREIARARHTIVSKIMN